MIDTTPVGEVNTKLLPASGCLKDLKHEESDSLCPDVTRKSTWLQPESSLQNTFFFFEVHTEDEV